MHGCHAYQEQMLEHLYGLLEEDEQRSLLDHLTGCPACQAALETARGQQQLLAAAARQPFPQVRFDPPSTSATALPAEPTAVTADRPDRPVLLPFRPRTSRPRRWRWGVAAALLLALTGLAIPAYQARQNYIRAAHTVREHQDAVADARHQLEETREQLARAAVERDQRVEQVRHDVKARELRLVVHGPRNVQPGAPADFHVRAFDLNGNPATADIAAQIKNADVRSTGAAKSDLKGDGKEAASGIDLRVTPLENGIYRVSIPPTLRLERNRDLDMVVTARRKGSQDDRDPLSVAGKVRLTNPIYLTHLTTDKPMYQPGEVVRFRSLTLDRLTMAPPAETFRLHYTLSVPPNGAVRSLLHGSTQLLRLDEKDQPTTIFGPDGKPIRGIGAGEFRLDDEAPGGEYTLTVTEELGRFPPVQRKFLVNRYQKPRLDKKLDFNRSSYGPGDEVQVRARATRADGGPVQNQPVDATITIDDRTFDLAGQPSSRKARLRTDADGEATVRFRLPEKIDRGAASLALTFHDGATETILRPIPIVLKKLRVEFFPEGGDLVAGMPNRVYFQARTPLDRPAQMTGVLLEDGLPLPVAVATLHDDREHRANQGLGVFTFTPKPGRRYTVKIDSPAGIAEQPALPTVRHDGVVLSVPQGVFEINEPIHAVVQTSQKRPLLVGAYCRGQLLDTVQLEPGQNEAVLRPTSGAGGVCRITAFEMLSTGQNQKALKPVAERLVYRHPRERLDLAISTDQKRYVPGQKANVSLFAVNEQEKFTPAIALVGVVDRSVLTLADEKTARSMPTHFLLTTEVRRAEDLEYADFLIGQHPKAPVVLDLLLGTQGWRRFAEQDPERFRERLVRAAEGLPEMERLRQQEEAERLLVMIGQSSPRRTDFDQEKIDRILADFETKAERLREEHREAALAVAQAGDDADYRAALTTLTHYQTILRRTSEIVVPVLSAILLLLVLSTLVLARRQRLAPTCLLGGLAVGCAILLLVSWGGPRRLLPTQPLEGGEVAALTVPEAKANRAWDADKVAEEQGDRGDDKKAMAAVLPDAAGTGPQATAVPPPAPAMPPGAGGMGQPQAMPAFVRGGPPGAAMRPGFAPPERKDLGGPTGPAVAMAEARDAEGAVPPIAGVIPPRMAPGRKLDRAKAEKPGRDGVRLGGELAQRRRLAEQLRRGGGGFGLEAGRGMRGDNREGHLELPLVFREYAHVHPTPAGSAVRSDFAETIYWHPVLVLNDGKANFSFALPDSVTSFEITAFAHTLDGRLGAATRQIESRLPFSLAPKVPAEISSGDRVDVAVGVTNQTTEKRTVHLRLGEHDGLELIEGEREARFDLPAEGRGRRHFHLRPTKTAGTATIRVEGKADTFTDAVRETFRIVPDGFPTTGASSDLLETSATHRIDLPRWLPGTLACRVDVYPSTLADLQKGLEALLREPHGCFEQSSTANYPNVLILDYLRTADRSDPQTERRARDLLARGYQKLTAFECQEPTSRERRGYEWFGGTAPPHEALTAYGLLQFRDMARVHEVDAAMLERTRQYLLQQRDGKGGFQRNPRALDSFGRAPQHITDAYIVWALTESGKEEDLARELDSLTVQARKSNDPYFLSLVGIALNNRRRSDEARELLGKLVKTQKDDGHLEAAQTSITGSGGRDLHIETTALAVLGWLKTDAVSFDGAIRKAVAWIGRQRSGAGGFGSTQSTILALKALIAHAREHKRVPEAGTLRLFVGENKVAEHHFPAGVTQPLTLSVPDAEKLLMVGKNTLRVEITGKKNIFPHTLTWECRTATPASSKGYPVELTTRLAKTDLQEGDAVRLTVQVRNVSGMPQGMAVAVIGLPAGLIVPEDMKQLKEHCRIPEGDKRPLIGAFELRGRELVLYWRDLARDQIIEVPIDLIARVPGTYRGPASRGYLYYNADPKRWIEPLAVTIAAKAD